MVFNSQFVISIIVGIQCTWIVIITFLLYRTINHYNRLTKGISHIGLKEVLEHLLNDQEKIKGRVNETERTISDILKQDTFHIQRVGIVRFNPFSDTGGSQSFSLSLLDSADNGIVITSLYARTGNRWYVKEVQGGKGKEVELAKEEQMAIKKAHHADHH